MASVSGGLWRDLLCVHLVFGDEGTAMSDKKEAIRQVVYGRSVVPFTGGLFAIWAFFWPESFAAWFGDIIHIIRVHAGL